VPYLPSAGQGAAGIGDPNVKIATTSARIQSRYMPDITAPMMAPARARPPPVSSPGALLMRRTADTPTQKAAGPSSIPKGQTSTTAAIARTSAKTARPSATGGGPIVGGAWMRPTGWTLVRHMALPRPAVTAAAAAPTTSKATNAAGAGRYVPKSRRMQSNPAEAQPLGRHLQQRALQRPSCLAAAAVAIWLPES